MTCYVGIVWVGLGAGERLMSIQAGKGKIEEKPRGIGGMNLRQ